MGEKNKTCVTKTLFTNFTRRNCFLQVWKNLFIVLKIRSHAKLTCIFVNCDENKKIFACCFPLRLFSRSLLSVVQSFVVRSLRILNSLVIKHGYGAEDLTNTLASTFYIRLRFLLSGFLLQDYLCN